MQFSDTVELTAPQSRVWQALNDAGMVGGCVPGLQEVEVYEDGRSFGGKARVSLGSSALAFPARVTWLEQEAPHGGRLQALVTIAGYAIVGDGKVALAKAEGGGTTLAWEAEVIIPQKLAENAIMLQMARTFATRFIQEFFRCLQARLE